jgi:hypothetical protein
MFLFLDYLLLSIAIESADLRSIDPADFYYERKALRVLPSQEPLNPRLRVLIPL